MTSARPAIADMRRQGAAVVPTPLPRPAADADPTLDALILQLLARAPIRIVPPRRARIAARGPRHARSRRVRGGHRRERAAANTSQVRLRQGRRGQAQKNERGERGKSYGHLESPCCGDCVCGPRVRRIAPPPYGDRQVARPDGRLRKGGDRARHAPAARLLWPGSTNGNADGLHLSLGAPGNEKEVPAAA